MRTDSSTTSRLAVLVQQHEHEYRYNPLGMSTIL